MLRSLAPDATWTVDEVLRAHPASAAVLNAFGVDTCCGGGASLGAAALDVGLAPQTLLDALTWALVERDGSGA